MLHISNAKKIINPYDGLSDREERDVRIISDGRDLVIEIFLLSTDNVPCKRELRFFDVCSYRKDWFPGPVIPTNVSFDDVDITEMYGSLIEFERSDLADAWSAHFENRKHIRHYLIHFLSVQETIGVLAVSYELREVTSV